MTCRRLGLYCDRFLVVYLCFVVGDLSWGVWVGNGFLVFAGHCPVPFVGLSSLLVAVRHWLFLIAELWMCLRLV